MKTIKRILTLLCCLAVLTTMAPAFADDGFSTSYTYTYDYWEEVQESPDAYRVATIIDSVTLGLEELGNVRIKNPQSLFVQGNYIYLCDTDNNRILEILREDNQYRLIRVISEMTGAPEFPATQTTVKAETAADTGEETAETTEETTETAAETAEPAEAATDAADAAAAAADTQKTAAVDPAVATWYLVQGGTEDVSFEIAARELVVMIDIREDKTFTYTEIYSGQMETFDGTWTGSNGSYQLTMPDGTARECTLASNKLNMQAEQVRMTLSKAAPSAAGPKISAKAETKDAKDFNGEWEISKTIVMGTVITSGKADAEAASRLTIEDGKVTESVRGEDGAYQEIGTVDCQFEEGSLISSAAEEGMNVRTEYTILEDKSLSRLVDYQYEDTSLITVRTLYNHPEEKDAAAAEDAKAEEPEAQADETAQEGTEPAEGQTDETAAADGEAAEETADGEPDGEPEVNAANTFAQPYDVCVDPEGNIYVADYGHQRIVKMDKDLHWINSFTKPDDATFDQSLSFLPKKIVVDVAGRVYALCQNVNKGLVKYEADGTFAGFIGANAVSVSMAEYIWKRYFMTKEQRAQSESFVPTEYENIYIDPEGFIYATNTVFKEEDLLSDNAKPIRRLNSMGTDILIKNDKYPPIGDLEWVYGTDNASKEKGPSRFSDITVLNNDIYVALDRTRGRLFGYDSQGVLLWAFGSTGPMDGAFTTNGAVSIEHMGYDLYVLDQLKSSITVFTPTEYGQTIYTASEMYLDGEYDRSAELWQDVLKMNANYPLAFRGIGRAILRQNRYQEAMEYFELAHDQENYGRAFKMYRKEWIEKNVWWIILILAALLIVPLVLGRIRRMKWEVSEHERSKVHKQ